MKVEGNFRSETSDAKSWPICRGSDTRVTKSFRNTPTCLSFEEDLFTPKANDFGFGTPSALDCFAVEVLTSVGLAFISINGQKIRGRKGTIGSQ